jgi:hypothetical protein
VTKEAELLDFTNANDLRAFEESFYQAFAPISNPGTRSLWIWDDEAERLRTRISYENQIIFIVRGENNRIDVGCAINVTKCEFQASAYGFDRPPTTPNWCEALVLFNSGAESLATLRCMDFGLTYLKERGFNLIYSTCTPQILHYHQRNGWKDTATKETPLGTRHLIRRGTQHLHL